MRIRQSVCVRGSGPSGVCTVPYAWSAQWLVSAFYTTDYSNILINCFSGAVEHLGVGVDRLLGSAVLVVLA